MSEPLAYKNGYRRNYSLLTEAERSTLAGYSRGLTQTEVMEQEVVHRNTIKYRERCIREKLDFEPGAPMSRVAWQAMIDGLIPGPGHSMGFAVWLAKDLDRGDSITRAIAKRVIEAAAEYDRLAEEGAA